MTNSGEVLSVDDMMNALADVQRRKLLVSLLAHNPQDDVPAAVADSEKESDAIERIVSMHHAHLPKLVDYGFIEWNEDKHEVKKGPEFDGIRSLLELLETHSDELPEDWL